jgi:hypothetical protein
MKTTMTGAARGRFWALLCAACVAACGGRADGDDQGTGEEITVDAGNDDRADDSIPSDSKKPGSTELGKCHPGEPPDVALRTCPWLAKGLCYQTKLEACACICPADRQDSVCSSGFEDGPYGQTEVKCY